ncbi:MAG: isopentenyl phosphate kinase family protein [Methanomicrobiales archaeon]|nr:isopentenyl phosphate kinase family protein [Methanomicrobiales archaeon]
MPDRTILKLGGSVITDKSGGDETIRIDTITEVARALTYYPDISLLLIHGAGSCGHPQAKQYHIQEGVSKENRIGIFETHQAVSRLNELVVRTLRKEGIEAISVHPLQGMVASAGELYGSCMDHINIMLNLGIVPVLHGDVVMDMIKGACIVSGDQLIRVLAKQLGMKRIGLATDVPGLLDADGLVVRELRRSMAHTIRIGGSGHVDVTGGMQGKISELLRLADMGIESDIFHISRLKEFLSGTDHGGTRIMPEAE